MDDGHVAADRLEKLTQGLRRAGVFLDGDHPGARFEQALREAAQARADLQDQIVRSDLGGPDDRAGRCCGPPGSFAPAPCWAEARSSLRRRWITVGLYKRLATGHPAFRSFHSSRSKAPSPRVDQGARIYTFTFRRPYWIASS